MSQLYLSSSNTTDISLHRYLITLLGMDERLVSLNALIFIHSAFLEF
jgi:hypothetical protein